jgi:serine/threonine-protein kinase HipA
MAGQKKDIWVFAHWAGMTSPRCIGILSAHEAKGRQAFSFEYDPEWRQSEEQLLLDPGIGWFSGPQFPAGKEIFGVFMDSMPDRWGRTLMNRRAAQLARVEGRPVPILHDTGYLLGVDDRSRMGALRFKLEKDGPFLANEKDAPIPPLSSIRELQFAAKAVESGTDTEDMHKWLGILLAPGSSLGGARPKANVLDETGHPWIAKFPSSNDSTDMAAWEYVAYRLALNAGVEMAASRVMQVTGNHHTFLTKRFDRLNGERIQFASAMTMTGNSETSLKDHPASYLDLAEFIQFSGCDIETDLHQLWRRIAFNIAVSNTDDHLRNHGFLLTKKGWKLSPAFDINPSADKAGLALNIDAHDNALDFELAKSVGEYFHLTLSGMNGILGQVRQAVRSWQDLAAEISISRSEMLVMEGAFRV